MTYPPKRRSLINSAGKGPLLAIAGKDIRTAHNTSVADKNGHRLLGMDLSWQFSGCANSAELNVHDLLLASCAQDAKPPYMLAR